MADYLGNPVHGKVIPRNYGTIKHLTGSRMKESGDMLLDETIQPFFTDRLQFPNRDRLFVTEKLDGANVGVFKKDGKLYPIMRKGYDVRHHVRGFIRCFADFVADNANRFDALLNNGERVCGEWMVKTHSLYYRLPHEPFVAFDIVVAGTDQRRHGFHEIMERCVRHGFSIAGLVWEGEAIAVADALERLGDGFHGCQDTPEGVVYRYERDGGFYMSAKYVANLSVNGDLMNDDSAYNEWTDWNNTGPLKQQS